MTKTNPIFKSFRESPGIRLTVLFGSFFLFLLLTSVISVIIEKSSGPARSHILLMSTVQCVLAFILPSLLLARFSSKKYESWLHLTKVPSLKSLAGVVIVYLISMPAMEWLIEWNSSIHFPASLSSLEKIFRSWEESGEASTKILLESNGWISVVLGVLVIGILTGFSEEMFFRGGLQGIFIRSSMRKGMAIWLTAIVFSAMHFQFFGFFPRLLMGAFFGYLLVWTGSLWVPIFAHVLNNSMVVIVSAVTGEVNTSILDHQSATQYFDPSVTIIGSVVLTFLFLILCRDSIFKTRKNKKSPWQKKRLQQISER